MGAAAPLLVRLASGPRTEVGHRVSLKVEKERAELVSGGRRHDDGRVGVNVRGGRRMIAARGQLTG